MKKYMTIFVLLLAILFTSCSQTPSGPDQETQPEYDPLYEPLKIGEDGKYSVYRDSSEGLEGIFLGGGNGDFTGNDKAKEEIIEYETPETVPLIQIGNAQFENWKHSQKKITYYNGEIYRITDEYIHPEIESWYIIQDAKNFRYSTWDSDIPLELFQGELTEESFLKFIKEQIEKFLPSINLEGYQCNISTTILVSKPRAAWMEEKEGFYDSPSQYESVTGYSVEYRIYEKGVRTTNCITVRTDEKGNLTAIDNDQYSVDWSACEVDLQQVDEDISLYMGGIFSSAYEVVSYTVKQRTLVCDFGKVRLAVQLDVYLKSEQEEIVVPVLLYLD
ncbi:MAG: hypothetical protein E7666_07125 [Ruminococcaceae bacterium]|nr:hypothetical protein [Oscillospiraceae bacterium]